MITYAANLVEYSVQQGNSVLAKRSKEQRKKGGQFLTPAVVARFMADRLSTIHNGDRILDPGIGSGTLVCAVIQRLIERKEASEVWIEGYEIDGELCCVATDVLNRASERALACGIQVHVQIKHQDFIRDRITSLCLPSVISSLRRYSATLQQVAYM